MRTLRKNESVEEKNQGSGMKVCIMLVFEGGKQEKETWDGD